MTRYVHLEPNYYECPECIREYEAGRNEGPWGEFKVTGKATPGESPTFYPNDKAHPGSPPEIDTVRVEVHSSCAHAEDDEVLDEVGDLYRDDFEAGDVWPDREPEPEPPAEYASDFRKMIREGEGL